MKDTNRARIRRLAYALASIAALVLAAAAGWRPN
jgi:hypothetical protein